MFFPHGTDQDGAICTVPCREADFEGEEVDLVEVGSFVTAAGYPGHQVLETPEQMQQVYARFTLPKRHGGAGLLDAHGTRWAGFMGVAAQALVFACDTVGVPRSFAAIPGLDEVIKEG